MMVGEGSEGRHAAVNSGTLSHDLLKKSVHERNRRGPEIGGHATSHDPAAVAVAAEAVETAPNLGESLVDLEGGRIKRLGKERRGL